MAQYLKSHSPDELWKASLKPQDPFKPEDPAKIQNQIDPASNGGSIQAAKLPGTGLVIDTSA